jgi:hypothetical protein
VLGEERLQIMLRLRISASVIKTTSPWLSLWLTWLDFVVVLKDSYRRRKHFLSDQWWFKTVIVWNGLLFLFSCWSTYPNAGRWFCYLYFSHKWLANPRPGQCKKLFFTETTLFLGFY